VGHLRKSGFQVDARDVADIGPLKRRLGVPPALESCHTAVVEGYVVEGHVPADLIERLLRERPRAAGLAVPGMPAGSPGMEESGPRQPYDVLLFDKGGRTTIFARR
jgi:hypothetical protein